MVDDIKGKGIEDFWLQCVMLYRNVISPPIFGTIISTLSELEKLPECSSVFEGDEQTPQIYLERSGVSVLVHINVCREIADLLKTRENDFKLHTGRELITALGHDIGKHPTAHVLHLLHSFKNALWLQKWIDHLDGREQIIAAIRFYRSDKNNGKGLKENPVLELLVKADLHARQKELKAVKEKKQFDNSMMVDGSLSLNEFDPSLPDTDPKNLKVWFSRENFLSDHKSRITASGFDAFYFKDHVYFSFSVKIYCLKRMWRWKEEKTIMEQNRKMLW